MHARSSRSLPSRSNSPARTGGIPPGEDAYGLTKNTTLFEDPPGVAGDGWPSGGSDPANGVVGVNVAEQSLVYRSTCTLPSVQHSICTVVLNDVIARYGYARSTQMARRRRGRPGSAAQYYNTAFVVDRTATLRFSRPNACRCSL